MTTAFITHLDCLKHEMGAGHPEQPARLTAIEDQLIASGIANYLQRYDAPLATDEQLARVHPIEYVRAIREAAPASGTVHLDPDTAMNPHSLNATLRAAGAAVLAVDLIFHDQVNSENSGACRTQRGLQRVRVHRRVRVEMHGARLGRSLADRPHVLDRMHARELLVGGERRLVALQMLNNSRGDQLVFDRGEALRALRMVRAHVVLEAVRVGDECGGHGHEILSHRVQSNHAAEG